MKRLIVIFYLIGICFQLDAQNIHFLKSYGNSGYDYGRDIKQTPDTGYIATGSSSSFVGANADLFLLKVDSLGNFKWSYNYGGPDSDWGNELVITHDSTYAVAGYTNSFGAGGFDFYLVRAGEFGMPIWEKTYGGSDWDKANSLVQIPADSGFVLVGETFSYGAGGKDIYIVRTDKNGDTLWTKTYGDTDDDWATGVIVDGDSIVVCGGTESYGAGMSDGIILKMDLNGNIGWVKVVGMAQEDYFTNIIRHSVYYYLSGSKSYTYSTDYNDFWVYKMLRNGGAQIADTTWDGDQFGHDIAHDIVVDPLAGVIFYGGSTTSWGSADVTSGVSDCFISKLDAGYGWMPYVQNFGDLGSDVLYGMDYCYDKGLIAIGDLDKYSTGGNNVLIVKIDKINTYGYISLLAEVSFENITLSAAELQISNGISVYPNPSQHEIYLEGFDKITSIELYDMQGNLCLFSDSSETLLNIQHLNPGTYILKISSETTSHVVRIVKS